MDFRSASKLLLLGILGLMMSGCSGAKAAIPGGLWINPGLPETTITGPIQFWAKAYPTNTSDPAIDYVNFTISWPTWHVWEQVKTPIQPNEYQAREFDPKVLSIPAGTVFEVSFDVYDVKGGKNLAPNGVHRLIYQPNAGAADSTEFVQDVTIPDGTAFHVGDKPQLKTWRLRNVGSTIWKDYRVVSIYGQSGIGASPLTIGEVLPGKEVDVSVTITIPAKAGDYTVVYALQRPDGLFFTKVFWVSFKVV
jgi:hypothetical protein